MINVGKWHGAGDVQAALILLLEGDIGRLLIYADSKTFQFRFNDSLVSQGLIDVQHDKDQVTGLGNGNDLPATTSTVLGSLNDTRKIDNLEGGTYMKACQ